MASDPRHGAALHRLARLQDLRVAADRQALDDAREAHAGATQREHAARATLARQEAELAELVGSGRFDPMLFAMKGSQIVAQADRLHSAIARAAETFAAGQEQERRWQASRYQRDWLHGRCQQAARKLHRKTEEQALREATGLIAIRTKGTPA